jgi:hypothetical protein
MTVDSNIKIPTNIEGAHVNTSRWLLTFLVVVQHLPETELT